MSKAVPQITKLGKWTGQPLLDRPFGTLASCASAPETALVPPEMSVVILPSSPDAITDNLSKQPGLSNLPKHGVVFVCIAAHRSAKGGSRISKGRNSCQGAKVWRERHLDIGTNH